MNINQLLDAANTQLERALGSANTNRLDAEILLGRALEVKRSFLYANPSLAIPLKRQSEFLRMVRQRCAGIPIAYLTGRRAFWTLELMVTPAVLIPRPETELLVQTALEKIPAGAGRRIADLGTGSGAIALAIATELPACEVHATDFSLEALNLARENARRLGLERVHFHHGWWGRPLEGEFDLVVSNPPYVAEHDPHLSEGDCRFEPRLALSAGTDGLESIRQVIAEAMRILKPEGWLLLEHGHDQGAPVRSILEACDYTKISTVRDLAGIERIAAGQKK